MHKNLITLKWKEISVLKNSLSSPDFSHLAMDQYTLTKQYQPGDH